MNEHYQMCAKRDGGLLEEALTHSVIGAFYDDLRELGFGFRKYLYALAPERDLFAKDIGSIVKSRSWSISRRATRLADTRYDHR